MCHDADGGFGLLLHRLDRTHNRRQLTDHYNAASSSGKSTAKAIGALDMRSNSPRALEPFRAIVLFTLISIDFGCCSLQLLMSDDKIDKDKLVLFALEGIDRGNSLAGAVFPLSSVGRGRLLDLVTHQR